MRRRGACAKPVERNDLPLFFGFEVNVELKKTAAPLCMDCCRSLGIQGIHHPSRLDPAVENACPEPQGNGGVSLIVLDGRPREVNVLRGLPGPIQLKCFLVAGERVPLMGCCSHSMLSTK